MPSFILSISKSDLALSIVTSALTTIGTIFTDVSIVFLFLLPDLGISHSPFFSNCKSYDPGLLFSLLWHNVRMSYFSRFMCLAVEVPEYFPMRGFDDCFCQMFILGVRVYIMMFQVMSRTTSPQLNQHRREEPKKQGGQVNSSKCDILLKFSPSQLVIMTLFFLRFYITAHGVQFSHEIKCIMMFQVISRTTSPHLNQHRREEPRKRGAQVNSSKCDILLKLSLSQLVIMTFFLMFYIWCEILHNCTKCMLWCFRSWAGRCPLNRINTEDRNPRNEEDR